MSPDTVNMGGVVGQATSFDLTLTGGSPYTYTQTFGNICDVSINNDTATVTITPVISGTLTGSITFNNEATCNITIDVEDPTPTGGLQPTTLTETMNAQDSKTFDFTLLGGYDSETEGVHYTYESSIENPPLNISYTSLSNPDGCRLMLESDNQTEQAEVGNVYVKAKIYDKTTYETLREYTATINLTIQGSEPTPPSTGGFSPTSMNVSLARADSETCHFELLSGSYDSSTETVDFGYTITSTSTDPLIDFENELNISEDIKTPPEYQLILSSNNESGETLTGIVNVYARISDADTLELLRTYTATINVTLLA